MIIEQIWTGNAYRNFNYLIACPETGEAMAIDPLNELLAVNYSQNLAVRGDWGRGKELMQGLIDLRPDSTILLRSMAASELRHGNLAQGWNLANRAWQLQPDNPEDISALAQSWMSLGEAEEAERLVHQGLEKSGQSQSLLGTYWMTLLVLNRFEEAETLTRDLMAEYGDNVPETLKRRFNFQLGMIAFIRKDFSLANHLLNAAIGEDDDRMSKGDDIWVVTMASLASKNVGKLEEAASRLKDAERKVQRARLNGVDDPNIYYTEAALFAMQDQPEQALEKLKQAYSRGFREIWTMDIDFRLDSLRNQPGFIALKNQISDDVSRARAEVKSMSLAQY